MYINRNQFLLFVWRQEKSPFDQPHRSCSEFCCPINLMNTSPSFPPKLMRVPVTPKHACFIFPALALKFNLCCHASQSHFTISKLIHFQATILNHIYVFLSISCSFFQQQQVSQIYSSLLPQGEPFQHSSVSGYCGNRPGCETFSRYTC
jgi:hypothetical protein